PIARTPLRPPRSSTLFPYTTLFRSAQRLGVPYLGAIPLEKAIREEADAGSPVVLSRPDTAGARAFRSVASAVAARISVQSFRRLDRKSTRLNSSHLGISYAVFCLKK